MTAIENRRKLGERAAELARMLTDDMNALENIRTRWDEDDMAGDEIEDLYRRSAFTGTEQVRVYPEVGGIWTYRDSLITEVRQAIEAADRLQSRLRRITTAVSA